MNELILVVDDEPKIVQLARDYLERSQYQGLAAGEGRAALVMARQERPERHHVAPSVLADGGRYDPVTEISGRPDYLVRQGKLVDRKSVV